MQILLIAALLTQDPQFTTSRLAVGDRADALLAEDLDGDGRRDLVVQSGLDLRVFLFRPENGFRKDADHVVRMKPNTFLWTFASFCDAKERALVTASARGIHRHPRVDGGGFARDAEDLIVHPTVFEGTVADGQGPIRLDFMPDLDGDGLPDAILFARGELFVMRQHRDGSGRPDFRLSQKLPVPIDAGLLMLFGPHQQIREVTSVPVIAFGDMNGDKRSDISYYHNEAIGTFFQQADGRYSTQDPRDLVEKKRKPRNTYLKFDIPPRIVDLDGDGLLDVVVVQPSKGRTHVYMNRDGRTDFTNPDVVLKVADGWSTGAYVKDLDRDGKMEIVMGVVRKFGIMDGIDAFISKKINLELHVFRYDAKIGRHETDPVQQLTFTIPFTFQATRDSANIDLTFRPNFDADVDGDGRADLLVERDARTLGIYYGVEGRLIADREGGTITLDPPDGMSQTWPFIADFNGDGRSDLALTYLLADKKHQLEVKLSRK